MTATATTATSLPPLTLAHDIIRAAIDSGVTRGHIYATTWTRGYVRVRDRGDADLLYVAGGRRKGIVYMLGETDESTTYCHRLYLAHADGGPLRVDDLRRAGIHCVLHEQREGHAESAGVAITL